MTMGDSIEISGFVLAGGRSSRLGRDKALLLWPPGKTAEGKSQTLLQHSIDRLQSVCTTVSVCATRGDLPFTGVVIPDALPGSGPLGGIVAALENSVTDWNLMLAVDLPFLPVEVLRAMVVACSGPASPSLDQSYPGSPPPVACVLPQYDGRPQPLCGLYHRALARGLRAALDAGNFKVMTALREACHGVESGAQSQSSLARFRVKMWDAAGFAAGLQNEPDPGEWFMNINTLQDWQQARQLRSQ